MIKSVRSGVDCGRKISNRTQDRASLLCSRTVWYHLSHKCLDMEIVLTYFNPIMCLNQNILTPIFVCFIYSMCSISTGSDMLCVSAQTDCTYLSNWNRRIKMNQTVLVMLEKWYTSSSFVSREKESTTDLSFT